MPTKTTRTVVHALQDPISRRDETRLENWGGGGGVGSQIVCAVAVRLALSRSEREHAPNSLVIFFRSCGLFPTHTLHSLVTSSQPVCLSALHVVYRVPYLCGYRLSRAYRFLSSFLYFVSFSVIVTAGIRRPELGPA